MRLAMRFLFGPLTAASLDLPSTGAIAQGEPWRAVNHDAVVLFRQGKYAEAEAVARQGLDTCDSAGPTAVFCRSIFWQIIADIAVKEGQPAKAETALKQSLAIRQEGLPATHLLVGDSLERLGAFYGRQGQWQEAMPVLEQAAAVLRLAGAPTRSMLITTLSYLYTGDTALGKHADAVHASEEAISVADAMGPEGAILSLQFRSNLAIALANNGRAQDGLAIALQGFQSAQQTDAPASPRVLLATATGNIAADLGTPETALPAVQSALRMMDAGLVPADLDKANLLIAASRIYQEMGRLPEASADAEKARSLADAGHADAAMAARSSIQFAKVAMALGRFEESAAAYHRGTLLNEQAFGADSLGVADAILGEAGIATSMGNYAAGEALVQQALDLLHRLEASPAWFITADRMASELKLQVGDLAAAQTLAGEAVAQLAQVPAPRPTDRLLVLTQRMRVAFFRGEISKAQEYAVPVASLLDGGEPIDHGAQEWATLVLGRLYERAGLTDAALRMAARLLTLAGGETANGPNAAPALVLRGQSMNDLGRHADAQAACSRAAQFVDPSRLRRVWLDATYCAGGAQLGSGHAREAAATFSSMLSALDSTVGGTATDRMMALTGLGFADRELGHYAASLRSLDAAVALAEAGKDANTYELADSLGARGSVLRRLGRYSESEDDFSRSLAAWERIQGGELRRAEALNGLGLTRLDAGDPRGAEQPLREALALRLHAGSVRPILESRGNVAELALALGKPREAAAELAAVSEAQEKLGLADSSRHATTLTRRADVAARLGATADAERLQRAAIEIEARNLGPDSPALANGMITLAGLLDARGAHHEAEALRHTALKSFTTLYGENSPITATARLADLPALARQGKSAEVRSLLDQCAASVEAAYGPDSPMLVQCLTASANWAMGRKALADAARDADRAMAISTRVLGTDNPALASLFLLQAALDRARDAPQNALAQCAKADALLGADAPATERASVASHRAAAQAASGAFGESTATLQQALDTLPPASEDAAVVTLRIELAAQLAALLAREGQDTAAIKLWNDLLGGPLPGWAVPAARRGLGQTLFLTGRPGDAVAEFDRAAAADRASQGADSPEARADNAGAAIALVETGRFDLATERVQPIVPATDWATEVSRLSVLVTIAVKQGDHTTASVHQTRLRSLLAAWVGPDSPALLPETVLLARIDLVLKRHDDARSLLREADAMAGRDATAAPIQLAQLRGEIAWDEGRMADAEAELHRAASLAAGPLGSVREQGATHAELGEFCLATGRLPEAERELTTALALFEKSMGPRSPTTASAFALLARVADQRGDAHRAAELRSRAQAILGKNTVTGTPGRWL